MNTLAEFGTGEVLWTFVWFTLFFIWIWILISVFADIFRSEDMGGWGKAIWILFVILLPYLGVFVYLIVRGKGMQERSIKQMQAQEQATRQYIQSIAPASSATDQIASAKGLLDSGAISQAEFDALKAKALS